WGGRWDKASIGAVLPEPTGPPTPTRSGPCGLVMALAPTAVSSSANADDPVTPVLVESYRILSLLDARLRGHDNRETTTEIAACAASRGTCSRGRRGRRRPPRRRGRWRAHARPSPPPPARAPRARVGRPFGRAGRAARRPRRGSRPARGDRPAARARARYRVLRPRRRPQPAARRLHPTPPAADRAPASARPRASRRGRRGPGPWFPGAAPA